MTTNQTKYPFQDTALELDTRVRDLVSRLTEDEKIESMLQYQPAVDRLGVPAYKHGTEAAHGLAWLGEATSFPQPVGLACTWDADLMKEIGSVLGDEARVFYKRNPAVNGLTLWAPTVDMERDPRWGRNEEAYGEDPELTAELTTALVKGIQGDHPKYYKAVATLKHFLANNNEVDRGSGSSSIDPRNMREYYLKAFEKPFKEGGAQSMMTAYNSINGTPALLHPFVNEIVKGEWGMDGFVVSDAGDVMGIMNDHKYYDSHTPGTVESVKAGIDSITDDAELSKQALREGLEQGTLTMDDIDKALFNTFRVRFRLGEFDPEEGNPYAAIGEESMMTEKAKELSLRAAREQVVLLKNDKGTLPLDKTKAGKVAVIGQLGGTVYRDWYAGTMPYNVSPLEAICGKVGSDKVSFKDGNDRITLTSIANGKKIGLAEGEKSPVIASGEAETFMVSDWGFGSYTLQAESNGKYLTTDEETVTASADEVYGWFVKEVFHLLPQQDGSVGLTTWNGKTVTAPNGGNDAFVVSEELKTFGATETFKQDVFVNGLEEAVAAAKAAETAIVFVGNNPLVNGKEEIDRPSLDLAESQQRLVEAVYAANPNTVVVIVGSYPFTSNWVQENIPAVLYTSHAGQELGNAVADVLYGDYAPAGRLNMTWVQSADQLTDIKDYDIIQSGRTYQYFEGNVLYPFGHGLTYATFKYSNLELSPAQVGTEGNVTVTVDVTNTGTIASDEVVQLYVRAGKSRVKRPLKTLKGFRRLHVEAGATAKVSFTLPVQELAIWDVTRDRYVVESGTYSIMVAKSSSDVQLVADLTVEGEIIPARNLAVATRAENYDAYLGVDLDESKEGGSAVRVVGEQGWIAFKDADLGNGAATIEARVSAEQAGAVLEVRLGSSEGTLAGRVELAQGEAQQWSTVEAQLTGAAGTQDIYIVLSAGVRISHFEIR
ncbi:glycoside hydrolase family 3 C-terminal domain-containing protein [Paenibacillus sp. FSL R5-0766]|uniref:glycoside hydrolase family 3 C-terminal domain-containing protein n=1 Tax=unclassified Paenibacillus TaxID=185978 RepID=UPI00096C3656|nr:glycoside hydrolase family 3 C-terminal domain-containing protein [Paenibacillus sp. FSL R5-0765]OMF66452.1 beta-glucosidase [Paenibacillus sp. FSL R5-0765]